jgi:NAD(P)-dependent dehydrogenase (short-subunit alcohol dehydrogenase family)
MREASLSTVLITGSSTGFGRDAAERLARRGHQVAATMRDSEARNQAHRTALETIAASEGLSLKVLEMDVTDEPSVQNAVARAVAEFGRLDVVINNAGFGGIGITEAYTPEQFQSVFDVNVLGAVRVNRAALPYMRRQRSGLLIHVSSGNGRVVVPAMVPYSASKFALEAIADGYRFELTPFGIESILVEPGIYRTAIFDKLAAPADTQRVADYGPQGEFADRILGTFVAALNAPGAPGSEEVAEAFVRLVEMDAGTRPFRTVVSASVEQLLGPYNAAAEALRPIIAQIFSVPELARAKQSAGSPSG